MLYQIKNENKDDCVYKTFSRKVYKRIIRAVDKDGTPFRTQLMLIHNGATPVRRLTILRRS